MNKIVIKEFYEIISDPVTFNNRKQIVTQHADLPKVKDELSLSLRLKLNSHSSKWVTIFHKGTEDYVRTPSLFLSPNESKLAARFTGNWNKNAGFNDIGDRLLLNIWYHMTYTLSDSEKRLDVYINGEWAGFHSISYIQTQKVLFNDGPLYIGQAFSVEGFNGEIGYKESVSVSCKMNKIAVKEFYEIISDPVTFNNHKKIVTQHADLPKVKDELSLSLRLKLNSHSSRWVTIFHKGTEDLVRTPSLFLSPNKSNLLANFTGNWAKAVGIEIDDGLLLNTWYHITYTLSDSEKRMDVYKDSEWVGFYSIQNVRAQKVLFNDGPLYIGQSYTVEDFNYEIGYVNLGLQTLVNFRHLTILNLNSNVRYFNWRLTAEEVMKNYLVGNKFWGFGFSQRAFSLLNSSNYYP